MDLTPSLLAALHPRDPRERVKQLVLRGWTPMQIFERLSGDVQAALREGPAEPVVADRQAIDRVHRALIALAAEGKVRRRRVEYGMFVNTKGTRGMIVDVFRL